VTAAPGSGAVWRLAGRDKLAQAVDSHSDPTIQFKEGVSLADVLKQLFGPFGWKTDEDFTIDNAANRNAKLGIRGTPMTKGGKKRAPRPLKTFIQHQLKPYPHEGVFAFAARVAQRHGLWIWSSADGRDLNVGTPDFDQEPSFSLRRSRDGKTTNLLSATVRFDMTDQPTIVVADGAGGGGAFGKSKLRSIQTSQAFYTQDPAYLAIGTKYKDAHVLSYDLVGTPQQLPRNRALYLHDEESKTQNQLDAFLRREMSLLVRKSLQVDVIVEGHGQLVNDNFIPWDVDTVVNFEDELSGVNERLYVLRRTFEKSRIGGTRTRLSLVRLHSIQLGDPDENDGAKPKTSTPDASSVPLKRHVTENF
jgi:prophage tail gpP-like protein